MSDIATYEELADRFGRQARAIGIGTGIVTTILGVLVMVWPSASLGVIAVLIGLSAIIGGIYRLVASLTGATAHPWLLGMASLILILGGAVILRNPGDSTTVFGLIIGAVWLVTGVAQFFAALFGDVYAHRGWMMIGGAISAIAGIVVLAQPDISIRMLAWLTGLYLVVIGIVLLIESWMVKP